MVDADARVSVIRNLLFQQPQCWELTMNNTWGPFYWHGLTLIPAWMSNHLPSKMWDEIIYPFPNFNGSTIGSLGMDK